MTEQRRSGIGAVLAAVLVAIALPNSVQEPGALAAPSRTSSLAAPATVPAAPVHLAPASLTSASSAHVSPAHASPAHASPNPTPASPAFRPVSLTHMPVGVPMAARPRGRLAVGDSLMISVTPQMQRTGFQVHAKVGRQFSTAPGIVRSYGARLPRNVVIELGTNGTVRPSDCRAVVRSAGTSRRVFLVTLRVPRSWQETNLRTLQGCDRRYRASRVRIIDWYGHSAGHPDWFASDRVHLTAPGQRAFARLIDGAVDEHGLG